MLLFSKIHYKTKLILCYLIPLSILLLITSIPLYNFIVKPVRSNAAQTIENRMNQEMNAVLAEIAKIESVSYLLSTNTIINNFFMLNYYSDLEIVETMNNDVYPLLSWLKSSNADIEGYHFFTNNSYIPETEFFHQYKSYQNENWMKSSKNALQTDTHYWETAHSRRSYGDFKANADQIVYSLFYPLLYADNYLEIEISPSVFFNDFHDSPVLSSGFMTAVNQNGESISGDIPINQTAIESFLKKTFQQNQISSKPYSAEIADSKYYICHRKIEPLNTWLVCVVPYTDIAEPLTETYLSFIGIMVLITLVIIFLSYLVSSLLVRRINKIIASVQRIQEGYFDINLTVKGKDEIDQLAIAINFMADKINCLVNQVYKAQILQKETELSALQAQINPHFLFNILDTFKMIALIHDLDDFSDSIAALGSLMRYNIASSARQCPLKDEIKTLKDYIKIQNLLLNDRVTLLLSVPESLQYISIPNFILEPLAENAFVHGFKNKLDSLLLRTAIYQEGRFLYICMEDNGSGISPEQQKDILRSLSEAKDTKTVHPYEHGIGLTNVYLRLLLQYQDNVSVNIMQSELGGACIRFRIPMDTV